MPDLQDALDQGYAARDPNLPYLLQAALAPLRQEPRFRGFLERMKLPG
jgi:hypothetical protein